MIRVIVLQKGKQLAQSQICKFGLSAKLCCEIILLQLTKGPLTSLTIFLSSNANFQFGQQNASSLQLFKAFIGCY